MRHLFYPVACMAVFFTLPALANEQTVSDAAQTALNLTIYNDNRALVKDTRTTDLKSGLNTLAFTNVSSQMIPESALLQGKGLKTQEQNFNFDLISYMSLMEKSVGSQVGIEYIDPATGTVSSGTAELLAFNGANPVLKIGNKIETNYPGRIIFNQIPDNLRSKPTLTVNVISTQEGSQPVNLSYLTGGLSWRADYVAELNNTENMLNLNGLVTLTNNSDTNFKNAKLQLVAGDVNMVSPVHIQKRYRKVSNMVMMADSADAMAVENLSDYYLYTLPRKTDILSKQTKQVSLLSGSNIRTQKSYEFRDNFDPFSSEFEKISPNVYFSFNNRAENGLGIALPKGIVRLYKADSANNMLLLGEDTISHTPNGETVRILTGKSFDITADMKRTAFQQYGNNSFSGSYQITIKNGGMKPTTVIISQNFGYSFKIEKESIPHQKETSSRAKWSVPVPANGSITLTYDVQMQQ